MENEILFGRGSLTMHITPHGIPVILVDGEKVGLIESIEMRSSPVEEGAVLKGKVVVVRYNDQSDQFIRLLKRVPWLEVVVKDMRPHEPTPDTLRTGS